MRRQRRLKVPSLSVSIVVYQPDREVLEATLSSLYAAADEAKNSGCIDSYHVTVVDNSERPFALDPGTGTSAFTLLSGHGNVGFGRGHNLAIDKAESDFHLILNPDVVIAREALVNAMQFAARHPKAGVIVPLVVNARGEQEFLCKRYPSVLDLFLRGFAPRALQRLFRRRLARYEMRDAIGDAPYFGPPLASGCFMLFRTPLLKKLGGFDPGFFLYFEDYDLSIRASRLGDIVYVPTVRITHLGGQAARKGWAHVRMFVASACRFYSRHGWRWL
jgi:GT2 family glycosyltransferase